MSLPFLRAKKLATVIIANKKPSGELEPKGEEGEHDPILIGAAEDLISAVHAKDSVAVADALKAAFEMMELPQEEIGE